MRTLSKEDCALTAEIDSAVKNKWNWSWPEVTVAATVKGRAVTVRLGDAIDKIDIAGKAKCTWCCVVLNYGSKGKSLLTRHLTTKEHLSAIIHNST